MARVCRRAATAIALTGLALALAGDAVAGPAGRLVTRGRCPGRGHMEAALAGVVDVDGGGEWTIAIEPDRAGARLTLRDRRGAVALERRLESRDCGAMARAFAVILHAFFRQLAAVRGESVERAGSDRRRRASPVDGAARPSRQDAGRARPRVAEPPPHVAEPPPPVAEPSPPVAEPPRVDRAVAA